MEIVILEGRAVNPGDLSWEPLSAFGHIRVYENTEQCEMAARIKNADAVLINKLSFTAQMMDACEKLRYIGELATGYNNIDVQVAHERGITVCNIPDYSTPSVVQHTFALLLELCAHAGEHSRGVLEGKWSRSDCFCYWDYPLTELAGKTLGVVGFGRIGQGVARAAVPFGMKVLACAAHPRPSSGIVGVEMTDFETLLQNADVLSLHCPLTAENRELICAETLSRMKPGALLINTARGGLVNEGDVAQTLRSGRLSGFAADVLSEEPPKNASPLFSAPNCVITPHIAWAPIESRRRLIEIAAENLRAFINGTPQNVVEK
ncbi:MAG: D-2-hydroxyacid dehydrogenase [Oscillospiraceae bacterium]|jgi:glycerate dehydrogenase